MVSVTRATLPRSTERLALVDSTTPFAAVLIVLGLALTGWGIFRERRFHRLAKIARVDGVITGIGRRFTRMGYENYPVVTFRTLEGAYVQTLIRQSRPFVPLKVGTQVTVTYDPAKPTRAYFYSPGFHYIGVGLLMIAAAILVIVFPPQPT
jgi:hypothetical protein